jgi:cytochrome c-type biogenesis protein CcmH
MRGRTSALLLAGAVLAGAGALALVAARGPDGPPTLQDRVRAVGQTLRCPSCEDLSVADSPAPLAAEMRAKIAGELRAGMTPAQIRAGFVQSYGEWILIAPPKHGITLVAWVIPALVALAGLVAAAWVVGRWTRADRVAEPAPTQGDRRLLDQALSDLPVDEA